VAVRRAGRALFFSTLIAPHAPGAPVPERMRYDAIIIGAGLSGLAAGIRLAYFDKRICILERHHVLGGLNSYYQRGGRSFDVGLHAVTNYVPPDVRSTPLPKLLRQLRLSRDEFDLRPQRFSEIRFPRTRLTFTNDFAKLVQGVAEAFPKQVDGFRQLVDAIQAFDETRLDHRYRSTREVLGAHLRDPALIDMLLCPLMFYGNAREHDMDFTQFVIMFRSIFLEGFARPRDGIRTILDALVRKLDACGGQIRLQSGVQRIDVVGDRVTGVTLDSGERLETDIVFSSAGYHETMRLCSDVGNRPADGPVGRMSFVESILVLDRLCADLGHDATITFFSDTDTFTYAAPDDLIDLRSGILCCPGNYEGHDDMAEGVVRVTCQANGEHWAALKEATYAEAKRSCLDRLIDRAERLIPGLRQRIVYTDLFTPRTIHRYTGHLGGAVYGAPRKRYDGRTRLANLFLCGTDQGYLGIIGSMISGITMANLHVLAKA
jgi:phytoene dehydrogenase-like protein